ncbi:MAG: DUF2905 domain-containing protein [Firmicutes bacterium]|nr:DUF2905 domain-containing protein [Bacillota bacterium]
MNELGKMLIGLGLILVILGGVVLVIGRVPRLGALPGDILIRRKGFTLYIPITTGLLLSLLISLITWFFRR